MRLLDLFCGGGLAAWGYWRSGRFSEIVGVDHIDMKRAYAFDFIQRDAYTLDYDFLAQFDFIHASPPCQYYSKVTPDRYLHKRSIPPVRHMLHAAGVPHVIENVEGSGLDLRPNLALTGHDVGLPMSRRRYFYLSFMDGCLTSQIRSLVDAQVRRSPTTHNVRIHGGTATKDDLIRAFGLNEISAHRLSAISIHHIEQGIPPAFTKLIAALWSPQKFLIGERASHLA